MMDKKFIIRTILLFFLIFLIFSCAVEKDQENVSIKIKKISFKEVQNRVPKESDFQVDLEFNAIVSDETKLIPVQYQWNVEYLKLDEMLDNSYFTNKNYFNQKTKSGYYFLEVSNNPLNALLSVYKEGFYKVTFVAYNTKETKEESLIFKVGSPDLPELNVKLNFPKLTKLSKDDFKGKLYLYIKNKENNYNLTLNAGDIAKTWYNTGIKIDPFSLIEIKSATHFLTNGNTLIPVFLSFNSNDENYLSILLNDKKMEKITLPLTYSTSNESFIIKMKKEGNLKWEEGNIFLSLFVWSNEKNQLDSNMYYEEKILNSKVDLISFSIPPKSYSKIFIGSLGHKLPGSNYWIYFTPEGLISQEFQNSERDVSTLPYGYLIGSLGDSSSIFGIGSSFYYVFPSYTPVYEKDKYGNYIIAR